MAGTVDARFEEARLGYSHMHSHTRARQTKKRQAPGGWGSPQERVLAHRGGTVGTELCLQDELLLSSPGCLFMVIFAAILFHRTSLPHTSC